MTFLTNLKKETTDGLTQNGAPTFTSTLSANLDFYAMAGSMRGKDNDIIQLFAYAYDENKELALRNLIHLRNIRLGGLGERDAFRACLRYLFAAKDYKALDMIATYAGYFGRWDDVVDLMSLDSKSFDLGLTVLKEQFEVDKANMAKGEPISLMAKWIPNTNVHNKERREMAYKIAQGLGYISATVPGKEYQDSTGSKNYRKQIAAFREYLDVLEVKLAAKDYDSINFEKLPSKALFKYRAAFGRHLEDEYKAFINRVNDGKITMNAGLMMPHEIVRAYRTDTSCYLPTVSKNVNPVLEATWKSLDDVLKDVQDNTIVVADTSASMTTRSYRANDLTTPWEVAEGLAIYTAERLEGAFKNHFITFSRSPQLIQLREHGSLRDKMAEYERHSIVENTDIEAVFDLILNTAVKNNTPQSELPSKIVIISDMEFDHCAKNASISNFDNAKAKFAEAGYILPGLVFWNVNASGSNVPVRFNEQGVALVSGFSTNVLATVLGGEISSPEEMMLKVLNKAEYDFVKEGV